MAIGQQQGYSNGAKGAAIRALVNEAISRTNAIQHYMAVKYDCTKRNTDTDTANIIEQWNAAFRTDRPGYDPNNKRTVIRFGPGVVNLLGAGSFALPEGWDITVIADGTDLIFGDYGPEGNWVEPSSVFGFGMGKNTSFRFFGTNGATLWGGGGVIGSGNFQSVATDYGKKIDQVWYDGLICRDQQRTLVNFNITGALQTEAIARETRNAVVATPVIGDGATTNQITFVSIPLKADGVTPKIAAGDSMYIETRPHPQSSVNQIKVDVASVDLPNNRITLESPLPVGANIFGNLAITTNAASAAGSRAISVAPGSASDLFVGRDIVVAYSTTGTLTTVIEAIDTSDPANTLLFVTLPVAADKAIASGAAITAGGSKSIVYMTPAFWINDLRVDLPFWHACKSNHSGNHRLVSIGSNELIAVKRSYIKAVCDGGQRWVVHLGTTRQMAELFQEYSYCEIHSTNFVHSTNASGGLIEILGFQVAHSKAYMSGHLTLNEYEFTAAESTSQRYIVVKEDLNAVVKKAGYSQASAYNAVIQPEAFSVLASSVTRTAFTASGAVAEGATAITLSATAASISTNATFEYTGLDGVKRFSGLASRSGANITLVEPVVSGIAAGAPVALIMTLTANGGQTRSDSNSENGPRILLDRPHATIDKGQVRIAVINAADLARPVGQQRLYTQYAQTVKAGQKLRVVDKNWIPANGDENIYHKCLSSRMEGQMYDVPGYQSIFCAKGGEAEKTFVGSDVSNSGRDTTVENVTIYQRLAVDSTSNVAILWSQASGTILRNIIRYGGTGFMWSGHSGTPQSHLRCENIRDREFFMNRGMISMNTSQGRRWLIRDIDCVLANAIMSDSVQPIVSVGNSTSGDAYQLGYIQDIKIEDIRVDTTQMRDEANFGYDVSRTGVIHLNGSGALAQGTGIRDVYVDGYLGISKQYCALRLNGGGKIENVVIGPNFDFSGLTRPIWDMILLSATVSTGNPTNPIESTVTTDASSAGSSEIKISKSVSYNLPDASYLEITLDTGIHRTWSDGKGTTSGIIKLMDPIPAGRSVASGAAVAIRSIGALKLSRPEALRYAGRRKIVVASGATEVTLPLTSQIFAPYRHSPKAPRPENVWCKDLSGNRVGSDILLDRPTITEIQLTGTVNRETEVAGAITFKFLDPANPNPASPKALTAETVFEIGFRQDRLYINR